MVEISHVRSGGLVTLVEGHITFDEDVMLFVNDRPASSDTRGASVVTVHLLDDGAVAVRIGASPIDGDDGFHTHEEIIVWPHSRLGERVPVDGPQPDNPHDG